MSIGGGGSSGTQSTTTQLDPDIKQRWLDLYNTATQTANQSTPNQQVAGKNSTQQLGDKMMLSAAGAGVPAVQKGIDTAVQLTGLNANPSVSAQRIAGDTTQSAPTYGSVRDIKPTQVNGDTSQSAPTYGAVKNISAAQLSNTNLDPYQNPYTNDVVNQSLNDIDLQRQRDINGNSSQFTSQGGEGAAFGSRAGVADALTNEAAMRQSADTSAQLRQAGYTQAQGAAQTDIGNRLTAATQNQNIDQQRAAGTYEGQLQTTINNQNAINDLGKFNATQKYDSQAADQAADIQRANTAYGGNLTTNLANQTAINNIQTQNVANNLQAQEDSGQFREQGLDRELSASGLLGTLGGQQQSMALTGAGAVQGVGASDQAITQQQLDANYQNAMNQRNLPLQTLESAFGILPSTNSGSVSNSHSTGKSGTVGL